MLPSWLRQLVRNKFVGYGTVAPIRYGLSVEALEDRALMAPVAIWTGGGTTNLWSNFNNWQNGITPGDGYDVLFNGSGTTAPTITTDANGNQILTYPANSVIDYNVRINDLQINAGNYHIDAGSTPITLTLGGRLLVSGGTGLGVGQGLSILGPLLNTQSFLTDSRTTSNLRIALDGPNQAGFGSVNEFSNTGSTQLLITATLTDVLGLTSGIVKTGVGSITLGGANEYTGVTRVQSGMLVAANDAAFGSAVRETIVSPSASVGVSLSTFGITDSIQIAGTGVGGRGALVAVFNELSLFKGDSFPLGGGTLLGGVTLTADAAIGADARITGSTVDRFADLEIDERGIGGAGNLTKVGYGDLALRTDSTFAGNFVISQGSTRIFTDGALAPGFSTTVQQDAFLGLSFGLRVDEDLFLTGNGSGASTGTGYFRFNDLIGRQPGALNLFRAGTSTWLGDITVVNSAGIGATPNATLLLAGELLGSAAASNTLHKLDRGNVRIAKANVGYLGQTAVDQGTLEIADARALGTGAITVNSTTGTLASVGTLQVEGSYALTQTLRLNGVGSNNAGALHVVPTAAGAASAVTVTGGMVLVGPATVNVDPGSALEVSGVISDGATPAAGLSKVGDGTMILSGNNTYTGQTLLIGGTTVVRNARALGTAAGNTTITSGAVLSLDGGITVATEPLTVSSSAATVPSTLRSASGVNTWAGTVNFVDNGGFSVNLDVASGASLDLTGSLGGASTVRKVGAGTVRVLGTVGNTNQGTLFIDEGTVALGKSGSALATNGSVVVGDGTGSGTDQLLLLAANQIADDKSVTVNSTGLFNLNGFNETIGGGIALTLAGGAVQTGAGTLSLNGDVSTSGSATTANVSGNVYLTASRTFIFRPTPPLTLTSNRNSSQYGETVTFTVTAVPVSGEPAVGGSVEFFDGVTRLGSVPLSVVSGSTTSASFAISTLTGGLHTIRIVYSGSTFYAPTTLTLAQPQAVRNTPVFATLTSSDLTAEPTQSVTFTYHVTAPAGSLAPTGTVTFYDNGVQIGAAQTLTTDGFGSVATTFAIPLSVAQRSRTITATYSGDLFFSSNTVTLSAATDTGTGTPRTVGQQVGYVPQVQISTNNNAVTGTRAVTLSFEAVGKIGQPFPQGTVQFFVDGMAVGTPVTLDANGRATYTVTSTENNTITGFGVGTHRITASFTSTDTVFTNAETALLVPAADFGNVSENQVAYTPVVYQVYSEENKVRATSIASDTVQYSDTTDLVFRINTNDTVQYDGIGDPNHPAPTGTVTFSGAVVDTAQPSGFRIISGLGTATVVNGVARRTNVSFPRDLYPPGNYVIIATYSGDDYYERHTENANQVILAHDTTRWLSTDRSEALIGEDITYSFNVTSRAFNTGATPPAFQGNLGGGTVDFYLPGNPFPITVNVMGGVATLPFPFSFNTPGTYTIRAVYSGDANFAAFTDTITQVVVAPFDAVLVSSANPAAPAGSSVTFTYRSTVATNAASASGTVRFYDGSNQIGAAQTLGADGYASVTTTGLTIGTHRIRAVFTPTAGSPYSVLQTSLDTLQVVGDPPQFKVTTDRNAAAVGESVTVQVSGNGISGIPTGRVTIYANDLSDPDSLITLATDVQLRNGVATFTTDDLSIGRYRFFVEYSGSTQYAPATVVSPQDLLVVAPLQAQFRTTAQAQVNAGGTGTEYPVTASTAVSYTMFLTASGGPTATGTVTFVVYNSSGTPVSTLGPVTVVGGVATANTTTPAGLGSYRVVAFYSGNANYEPISIELVQPVVSALPTAPLPTTVNRVGPVLAVNAPLSGAAGAGITATGAGQLILNAANTYSGTTVVNGAGATVTLGANNVIPDGSAVNIVTGTLDANGKTDTVGSLAGIGVLNLPAGSAFTAGTLNTNTDFSGTLTGPGTLNKVGTGALTLGGTDGGFTGTVNVAGGTVFLGASYTGGRATVQAGATLGGSGTLNAVTVNAGGTLSPGGTVASPNTVGVLTGTGNLTLAPGAAFVVNVNGTTPGAAVSGYDQYLVTSGGSVNLNGATLSFNLGYTPALNDSFTLISVSGGGTLTGTFAGLADLGTFVLNNRVFQIDYTATGAVVTMIAYAATPAVTSSNNPALPNTQVTFTFTLTPTLGSDPRPTGTVQFLDNGVAIGAPVTLTGGATGTATATLLVDGTLIAYLTGGAHTITAVYAGDANYQTVSPTLTQLVTVPSTTVLTPQQGPIVFGDNAAFLVAVPQTLAQVPTGTVTFVNAATGAVLGVAALDGTGRAVLNTTALPPGNVTITATYSGDNFYRSSSGSATQVVDRQNRVVVGSDAGPVATVQVFDSRTGALLNTFRPFDQYTGGVKVATGDVNGDGVADIVVSAGAGAPGGHVKVYDGVTFTQLSSFFTFIGFNGGVNIAVGDVDNDGFGDVVIGTANANDHVKVFSGRSLLNGGIAANGTADPSTILSFFAYGGGNPVGVTVGVGDVDGDGRADIITGSATFAGHVKAFSGNGGQQIGSYFAYGAGYLGGIYVAGGDLDGDGRAEIITGATNAPHVKALRLDGSEVASFFAFLNGDGSPVPFGVRVAAADRNGDRLADILVGAGSSAPAVKVFSGLDPSQLIESFLANPQGLPPSSSGVFVGGSGPK